MSKHTPGPWTASEGSPSDLWHVDMPDRQFSITVARGDEDWDMSVEEVQANARLIAAAPDLLDALQALVAAFDADLHDLMIAKLAAQASIAQATGPQEDDVDPDGIPMPRDLPYPGAGLPGGDE